MKRKFLTALTLAVSLLLYSPAFAKDHKDKKSKGNNGHHENGHHAESAKHQENGAHAVAVSRPIHREQISNATSRYSNGNYSPSNSSDHGNGNNNYGGTYAFSSHPGWNRGNEYNWSGHHYRWYNNAWFIIGPAYGSNYTPAPAYTTGRPSVAATVQSALARQGYYRGPIDGLIGPGSRSAIAAYQRDNGLTVTGTINSALVNNLGV